MGCYNMTGCISKLPILVNNDCVGLICVKDTKSKGEEWAPSLFLNPIFPAFFGRYDEYGRLEDCNVNDEYLSKFMSRFGLTMKEIQDACTDHDDKAEEKMREVLSLEEGMELALCLEHRQVYDFLVSHDYEKMCKLWDKSPRKYSFLEREKESIDPTITINRLYQDYSDQFALYYYRFHEEFWKGYTKKPYCELVALWETLERLSISFTESVYCSQSPYLTTHITLYGLYSNILDRQKLEYGPEWYEGEETDD